MRRMLLLAAVLLIVAGLSGSSAFKPLAETSATKDASPYLVVWTGDGDRKTSDFLAVIDADPGSEGYGRVVATLPVNAVGTMPHHTEYEFPAGGVLLANAWVAGRTFVFDLRRPAAPKLLTSFTDVGDYSFPHSFARLPNGNVLSVFQSPKGGGYRPGGGLVEMNERGEHVRSASALDPKFDLAEIWPYSLAVDAARDRVITVNTPMGTPPWAQMPEGSWPAEKVNNSTTSSIQLWRLSDLKLLATLPLPPSGRGKHHEYPAEPRLLPDGSVYVNTFPCGLYHVSGHATAQPALRFVHAFEGGTSEHDMCGVPVVLGKFWIQPVPAIPGLIALDISDPEKPVEVSRLKIDDDFHMPHWLGADRKGSRVVVTGDVAQVYIVDVDPQTGKMTVDKRFRDEETGAVGVNLARPRLPHGKGGKAQAHGALFAGDSPRREQ